MGVKDRAMMMAAFAFAMLDSSTEHKVIRKEAITPDDNTLQQRHKEIMSKRGVKEFTIDGYTVRARNYSNALRKVANIKKSLI